MKHTSSSAEMTVAARSRPAAALQMSIAYRENSLRKEKKVGDNVPYMWGRNDCWQCCRRAESSCSVRAVLSACSPSEVGACTPTCWLHHCCLRAAHGLDYML